MNQVGAIAVIESRHTDGAASMREKKLASLRSRAAILKGCVTGIACSLLSIYDVLRGEDVTVIDNQLSPHNARCQQIADATGLPIEDVIFLLGEYVRHDLGDYSAVYASLLAAYERCKDREEEIESTLSQESTEGLAFLLYGCLEIWNPATSEVDDLLVEGDYDDDPFPEAVSGYLVSQRLAFNDSLELLEYSDRHQWANWRELWRKF